MRSVQQAWRWLKHHVRHESVPELNAPDVDTESAITWLREQEVASRLHVRTTTDYLESVLVYAEDPEDGSRK